MLGSTIARAITIILGTGLWMTSAPVAAATTYPDKPIHIIVPFTPGGSTDVIARIYARKLGTLLGKPVVVENKPGAGTIVGADAVAKATPDGYTLLLSGASTFTVNSVLYKSLPYAADKAFEPLGIIASTPLVLLANTSLIKANTLKQLISELQGRQDVAYASFGNGSTSHFVGEMFKSALGLNLLHVPYRGSSPAMNDLIGGQVALSVDTAVAAIPQLKGKKIKALAVSSAKPLSRLPEVQTATQSGFPAVQYSTWFAITAPAGLPEPVRRRLVETIRLSMDDQALRRQFIELGYEPDYQTPDQYRQRVAQETQRLKAIAAASDIVLQP